MPASGETEEQVARQVEAIYRTINRPPPDEMVSLAARLPAIPDKGLLEAYGDIVLLVDWREIAPDLVIFNGDVKNLGAKLVEVEGARDPGTGSYWLRYITLKGIDLASEIGAAAEELSDLRAKSRNPKAVPPRLLGQYFEARLFRALRPMDIAKVFVPQVASSELDLVAKLLELKKGMLASRSNIQAESLRSREEPDARNRIHHSVRRRSNRPRAVRRNHRAANEVMERFATNRKI